MKDDIVHLTFPTDKGTKELLNKIAEIKEITQPKLLNEICQDYIQKTLIDVISYMENKGIDINELLTKK